MGWTIGIPSLKLNNVGRKSKHCGSFGGIVYEALPPRKGKDPDIDPTRSHLNIYEGFTSAKALMEYSAKHVAEMSEQQRAEGKRGIREDAVVMCSTIFKPPAEMMAAMSYEDQIRFLRDANEVLDEIIGSHRCRSNAYHFDEQGGHLHKLWEPITDDGRLCAKELHNIKFFGRVNREMPQRLREKGWDIDDCQCYDAAKEELLTDEERREQMRSNGRSSAVYKRDQERAMKRMKEQTVVLEKKVAGLETQLQAQRDMYEDLREVNEKNIQIIEHNEALIQHQTETLGLIRSYEEYRETALAAHEELDDFEKTANEMASKKFAPPGWRDFVKYAFSMVKKVVNALVRKLQVYEKDYGVEDNLSNEIEKRVTSLDEQITGAEKRRGTPSTSERSNQEPER